MTGRKRHILVDTLGLLLAVVVTSASVQDRDGGRLVVERAEPEEQARLELIWADGAYAGDFEEWAEEQYGLRVEIVSRAPDQKGFKVLPRRWVVERTLAWLTRNRRLARDYERNVSHSEAFVHIAMTTLMLRRLCG